VRTSAGQHDLFPSRGRRPLLTAFLGWLLVFAAFNQFQPTLLVTLQSFLAQGEADASRDDDRDGDEVTVADSAVGRPQRRRDCPVPPDVEPPHAVHPAGLLANPPQTTRALAVHVPDGRNGIGAHLRC
jgi:hypothetical protein